MSAHAYHRYAKRKKKSKKRSSKEPLLYFAVAFGPLMTIPQVYDIWVRNSRDVSLVTWVAYIVTSIIWLVHGFKMKDKALIIVQVVWVILSVAIVAGLLLPA